MTDNVKYIINYTEGNLSRRKMLKFEKELQTNIELQEDYSLYIKVNEYIKEISDYDEVINDPDRKKMDQLVNEAVSEYILNPELYIDNRKFIEESLLEKTPKNDLKEEINQIKKEISDSNLNEFTEKLVSEYLDKKNTSEKKNSEIEEMRNYIQQSLKKPKDGEKLKVIYKNKEYKRLPVMRIVSLSAAMLIFGFVLIKILIPSNSPEKIYSSFYKTYSLESQVTRGNNTDISQQYEQAVNFYNNGKYNQAYPIFSSLIQQDTSSTTFLFFLGVTELELGNYKKANLYLSKSLSKPNEFSKEAQWYLGLSYLKLGEKEKAVPYFEILSISEGFYKSQAEKLLGRLK